jgi:branched-chain amino acid transport system substrate-binding protein
MEAVGTARIRWWARAGVALGAVGLLAAGCSSGDDGETADTDTTEASTTTTASGDDLVVGALLDLSGSWSTLGETSQASLDLAVDAVNSDLAASGASLTVSLVVEDTAGDPDQAVAALEALHEQGVDVVVGPQSSAEVRAVQDLADQEDILVVSQGSTASDLAVEGDNVFRFIPPGVQESDALVQMLSADAVTTVVPMWRDDAGNADLVMTLREAFTGTAGTVTEGASYAAEDPDFDAALGEVSSQLADAGEGAAVYLGAFSEVGDLFEAAAAYPDLQAARWYGSDGVVFDPGLVEGESAAFAVAVGYPNPIFGLDPAYQESWTPVVEAVDDETGLRADAFSTAAYDALVVAVEAVRLQRGGSDGTLAELFVQSAADHVGLNGPTTLDAAGDRVGGAFSFFAICETDDGYEWAQVAAVSPRDSGSTLTRTGCP